MSTKAYTVILEVAIPVIAKSEDDALEHVEKYVIPDMGDAIKRIYRSPLIKLMGSYESEE